MAVQRLQKELRLLSKDPLPSITARPDAKNILVWHYVLEGDASTEYAGGVYHGKITFPSQYPFRPPAIVMVTPSGRFQSNTRLCLSMSDYHPESWNPSWSVASILTGLQSFFYENTATTGSVRSSKHERRRLASASRAFNEKNPAFRKAFPERRTDAKEIPPTYARSHREDLSNPANQVHTAARAAKTPPWRTQTAVAVAVAVAIAAAIAAAGPRHLVPSLAEAAPAP